MSDPQSGRLAAHDYLPTGHAMIKTHQPWFSEDEERAIDRVLASRWVGKGLVTEEFEQKLAEYLGAENVMCANSGTAALHLALEALDLEPGSEVLVPSITFPSTIQAIVLSGLRPIFCEVDPSTVNVCISDLASRIRSETRAILPVHYAGFPCDLDQLKSLASLHDLHIVEDAAHAFGSTYKGQMIGVHSDSTCFSFDALKTITTVDGGAVATANDRFAQRIRRLRNIGIDPEARQGHELPASWKYLVTGRGFRYAMSNLNAAIGLVQLARIQTVKQRKQEIFEQYSASLRDIDELTLLHQDVTQAIPFAFVVRIQSTMRDALSRHLKEQGIETAVHFVPNHLQPAFQAFRQDLPVTDVLFQELLSLPFHTSLTDVDVRRVINEIKSYFAGARR